MSVIVTADRTSVSEDITSSSATGPSVSVHAADTSRSITPSTSGRVSSRIDLRSPRRSRPISHIALLTATRSVHSIQQITQAASAAYVSRRV
tara:strand:+ start:756 stop:1031 length:276 start_codon:yes stop_codon:yes gene_type:complete